LRCGAYKQKSSYPTDNRWADETWIDSNDVEYRQVTVCGQAAQQGSSMGMNAGPDRQPVDGAAPGRIRALWTSGRLTLFCCFMLSGLALEAYCVWFRFAAHCEALVPFPLFLAVLLVPAAASIIFAGNLYYRGLSLSLWGLYGLACLGYIATNERSSASATARPWEMPTRR
jgi:hypothetical protein